MNKVRFFGNGILMLLLLTSMTIASFGQVASSIELTGTSSSLSALYNVETIVDPNVTVNANGTIGGFRVQISESYSSGDILTYTGTLPSGINQSWSATTGVLSFSGTGTAQQWQDILRAVKFKSTSSVCYPTARSITFTAGTVYYNPLTGHFYEYVVLSPAQSWAYSKTNSETRSYFGRIGYLATFSSAAENNFVWKIMANDGWFGASDDFSYINSALGTNTYANQGAAENKWSWVSGPEAGTQFSNGSSSFNGRYANWNGGEPNNSGGEHYGQFYSGSQGRWNDLRSTHTLGGYLCEFGGMPNDNTDYTPFVSRSITVTGSSTGIITGGGVNVCTGANSTTLAITNFTGTVVRWESSPDNFLATVNNISSTSTSLLVTNITQTTYYRAVVNTTSPNTCNGQVTSSVPIYVTPTIAGNITAINNQICAGGDVELTLSGNQGNVNKWQWSSNGGTNWTNVMNTTTFLNQTIASAGTYLFRAEVETPGCGVAVNTANKTITVISGTPPDGGVVSSASYCGGSNSGTLNLTGYSGTISTWQRSTDEGTVWADIASTSGLTSYGFSGISASTLYRVKVTNGTCGTAYSDEGAVNIYTSSVAGTATGTQNVCGGSGIANISLSGNTGTIQWTSSTNNSTFSNISGATASPLTQSNLSGLISQTMYYRATVTNGACASVNSNTITATYIAPTTYYQDSDADGFGKDNVTQSVCTGQPTGYTTQGGDCNDLNAAIKPTASETCNLIDDNCNGSIDEGVQTTFYVDFDGDGYGNPAVPVLACTQPTGYVNNNGDFNDNDPNAYNGAPELCDGIDNDGDALIDEGVQNTYYADSDGDGFGDINVPGLACSQPLNYVTNNTDCNDLNAAIYPFGSETCNGVDDDCDLSIDEGVKTTYYADADGDTYGNLNATTLACSMPTGYVVNAADCNDANVNVNPAANEICNTIDDDCDNTIDEGVQNIYYLDADGDGFGIGTTTTLACTVPANYSTNSSDCDDTDNNVNTGANEICNYIDDNCIDGVDEGVTTTYYEDADGDGYGIADETIQECGLMVGYAEVPGDCDDSNANVNPSETEICNTIDDDCDEEIDEFVTSTFYLDTDNDGFGDANGSVQACSAPLNYVSNNDDCDDVAVTYLDSDGDGFGSTTEVACGEYNNTDCNDSNATLNSISAEVCNNFDDDCDGSVDDGLTFINYYVDNDGDGYGAGAASNLCSNPGAGYVTNNTDCNDNNATLNAITVEVCNNFDDDCDGSVDDGLTFINYYVDNDGDGYGAGSASNLCSNPGVGFVTNNTDCNDNNATLNAITIEVCNNFDDDCDGSVDDGLTFINYYVDNDGDGYGAGSASNLCSNPGAGFVTNNTDCNDNNATVHTITTEVCNNFDDDCDGSVDDGLTFVNYYVDTDGDGYGAGAASNLCSNPGAGYVTNNTDCNNNNATVHTITTEVCNNFDDDCDGTADDGLTFVNYYVDTDGDGYGAGAASNLCSNPGAGYVTNNTDCNNNNATVHTITTEVCNNFDDDCDGAADDGLTFVNYYVDTDGDGYGAGVASNLCSNPGAGYVTNNTDCNNNNATVHTITSEVCNNFDDDCDGTADDGLTFVNYYVDTDGDGYGAGAASNLCSNPGAGYVTNNTDCNNNNATVHTITAEVCNNFDDDCDGTADDGLTFVNYYVDTDGDGYGAGAASNLCSNPGAGYVTNNTDCNNNNATVHTITAEMCNNFDDDCDGTADDGLTFVNYYVDTDGDGYGAGAASNLCSNPGAGYVTNNTDCNNSSSTTYPGANELCNGIDDDCDSFVDDNIVFVNFYVDTDGDGYGAGSASNLCSNPGAGYVTNNTDCNDNNATVHTITTEVCNNFDDDCDGSVDDGLTFVNYYVDTDGDGYGAGAASNLCSNPGAGYVTNNTDCNNNNATVHTITTEVCNNFDDDCDGSVDNGLLFINYYVDNDGDGYGAGSASNLCADPGAGYVTNNTDCNDNDATLNSISAEVCNNFDDDCDGSVDNGLTFINYYVDNDGDGYGAGSASNLCADPGAGYVTNNTDCNDNDATLNSISAEVCNNFDDDCDGSVDNGLLFINYYVDNDGDGYGAGSASNLCADPGAGYVTNNTDCNDNDATLNSISAEVCNNFDDDCDGSVDNGLTFINYYVDNDGDGYGAGSASNLCADPGAGYVTNNTDCNDNDATLNSISAEVCNNFDDDCDGSVDNGLLFINYYVDNDGDGYGAGSASNLCADPGAGYVTNNTDCNDNDATLNSISTEVCNNFDDDCDGSVDNGLIFINYFVDNDGDGFGAGSASNLCADPGAGYTTNDTDCNDNDATLNAISVEVCNNFDDDCNGLVDDGLTFVDYFVDNDGDGYGTGAATNLCADPGVGFTTNDTDCDDAVATTYPGASEACNGVDDDCNGVVDNDIVFSDYFADNDGDGYGAGIATSSCSDLGAGYVTDNTDCNDADNNIYPTAVEVCNYIDDNCDTNTDEGVTTTYYEDADGDGYGNTNNTIQECGLMVGYSENGLDCNDTDANINPEAIEVCNTIDDDCDGETDEFVTTTFFADNDGDGFGDASNTADACEQPTGFVANADDCDDATLTYEDVDGDGYGTTNLVSCGVLTSDDCDDAVSTTYPSAAESCNDVDDDCNGVVDNDIVFTDYFADNDGDGYGAGIATSSCSDLGAGYVTDNTDCNDADNNIYPTAVEVCNYIDDNCDTNTDEGVTTTYYEDADGDGYGNTSNTIQECGLLVGYSENGLDCNDTDANINPEAIEVCNTIDDDCDGETDEFVTTTFFADNDGDGFGDASNTADACEQPTGFVANADDCDDATLTYEDVDGDGYGNSNITACGVLTADDCDDAVATTYPGASEACNDVDDDCNGVVDNDIVFTDYFADNDGDGYGAGIASSSCSDLGAGYVTDNTDCNDADNNIYPTAVEVCNYIDDNCDTNTDEGVTTTYYEDADGDGYGNTSNTIQECGLMVGYSENGLDCNDTEANINPEAIEVCNTIDDDCDGEIDEFVTTTFFADNDGDGFGDASNTADACEQPTGFVANADDCDDATLTYEDVDGDGYGNSNITACGVLTADDCDDAVATTYPGASEACNDVDDDCNGVVDNDIVFTDYFADNDGDGYGAGIATSSCSDLGAGYVTDNTDCNDADNNIYPTAVEVCNYIDDNCDTNTDEGVTTTYYEDADGDGYGNTSNTIQECGLLVGYSENGLDCNDTDANINPESIEVCNTIDDDCDGETDEFVTTTFFADNDGDGFGDASNTADACEQPTGFVANADDCDDATLTYEDVDGDGYGNSNITACGVLTADDCDDAVATTYPGAAESCNEVDDDCNGVVDNDIVFTDYFADNDGDGYGAGIATSSCSDLGAGYVTDNTDCNDAAAGIYPGATEVCNASDDDCNGVVDNDIVFTDYFADNDGDGFGAGVAISSCSDLGAGYTLNATDCDDTNALSNPNGIEVCGNGIDENCDGVDASCAINGCTDAVACNYNAAANTEDGSCTYPSESYLTCDGLCINDTDTDGVCDEIEVAGCTDATACNYDANATEEDGSCIMPIEEVCNTLDDDCDGEVDEFVQFTYYNDVDGDGFGNIEDVTFACTMPAGYVSNADDCDDSQIMYLDADGDGYGVIEWVACGALVNGDCDDNNGQVYPSNTETCNLVDDNCDGNVDEGVQNVYYFDNDGDGFGWATNIVLACTAPTGYVSNAEDCDDTVITYQDLDGDGFGSLVMVACGVTDNTDCNDNQLSYADNDGDGFGAGALVACGLADNTDCDDANASVNTAMTEVCNEVDDNCDGVVDEGVENTYYADNDGDGFGDVNNVDQACSQPVGFVVNADDCNDNALTYLDADGDGFGVGAPIACGALNNTDCSDNNNAVYPGAVEVCNGLDDNCSGTTDEGLLITFFQDTDADGFGNPEVFVDACSQPVGFVLNDTDCNDALSTANPSGTEVCNGIDEDCDGLVDEGVLIIYYADADGDGYGNALDTTLACLDVDGYVLDNTDCNDDNSTAFPGAQEINDDIDNDCDGLIDEGFEFIPDAFSPNGDGDYDLFELQDLLPNEVVTIQVFNRWGGLVYESENYQNDWDGKGNVGASSGEHLAVGTYFFIIHLNEAQLEKNGYITLWR